MRIGTKYATTALLASAASGQLTHARDNKVDGGHGGCRRVVGRFSLRPTNFSPASSSSSSCPSCPFCC